MMNQQTEEFILLWNQLLKQDRNPELYQRYPNFSKLTVNEISVINLVSKNPQIILKDICTALELPKSTLTNVINALDKKGYLFRTIAKQDYRSYGLELTEKGVLAQEEHLRYENETISSIFNILDEEECNCLMKIMKKLLRQDDKDETRV